MVPLRLLGSALLLGCLVLAAPASAVVPPVLDADGDALPDVVESHLCARHLTANLVSVPLDGAVVSCVALEDLAVHDPAPLLADADADGLPEGAEVLLCGLQDRNEGLDGTCDEAGYHLPQ